MARKERKPKQSKGRRRRKTLRGPVGGKRKRFFTENKKQEPPFEERERDPPGVSGRLTKYVQGGKGKLRNATFQTPCFCKWKNDHQGPAIL